jgi:hypothetical protein
MAPWMSRARWNAPSARSQGTGFRVQRFGQGVEEGLELPAAERIWHICDSQGLGFQVEVHWIFQDVPPTPWMSHARWNSPSARSATPESWKGSPKVNFPQGSGFQTWRPCPETVLKNWPARTLWCGDYWLLITEFIEEVSPLLPNPGHFQDYDRSMFPLSLVPRDCPAAERI